MAHDTERDRRIRERAFYIWKEEGKPHGRDREHWEKAEREIIGGGLPHPEGENIKPGDPIGEVAVAAAREIDDGKR